MNRKLRKSIRILIITFCCIFLPESVASKEEAPDMRANLQISAEIEEKDMYTKQKENDRRYLDVYINEDSCIKIDIIFIFGILILCLIIVLEKTQ